MKPFTIKNRQNSSRNQPEDFAEKPGAGGCHKVFFLLGIGLLLFSWSLIAYCLNQPILVPGPAATYRELVRIVGGESFGRTIAATVWRFLLGFGLTALLAMLLGAAAGLHQSIAADRKSVV